MKAAARPRSFPPEPPDDGPASPPATARTARRRDPAAARAGLIAAAIAAFARDGFAGARVDQIAAAAGVNKQLVYHYFDSKEGLYLAALESVYAEIREKERALHLGDLEPLEAMARLVGFSFDHLARHPEFIALLVDENRNRGSHILASQTLRRMHSPFIALLRDTLARGIAQGVFRPDLDAIDVYISIAGISFFFFSNNHTLSAIFGKALGTRAALARRRRHVIAFALAALRAPPG